MLKSIWFWLLLVVGIIVLYFAWDRIEAQLPDSMVEQPTRTTNTQQLAKTITPAKTPDWDPVTPVSGSSSNLATPKFVPAAKASRDAVVIAGSSSTTSKSASTPRYEENTSGASTTSSSSNSSTSSGTSKSSVTVKKVTYTVKPGNTLYSIAKRYGIEVKKLAAANGISDPDALKAGTVLIIPVTPIPTPRPVTPPPGASTYTVKSGDTLSSIARRYNTSPGELQKLNRLANPNQIRAGTVIIIPGGSSSTGSVARSATRTPTNSQSAATTGVTPSSALSTPTRSSLDSFNSAESLSTPQSVQPTITLTPLPTKVNRCPAGEELVLVWGLSFCQPEGWTVTERGAPDRAAFLVQDAGGERAMVAVVRPGGWPNAPASYALRGAKGTVVSEAAAQIPGGIAPPEEWTAVQTVTIAGTQGQMIETKTIYNSSGEAAQVRLITFEKDGQWWHVILIAPQDRWGYYSEAGLPPIAGSLQVF